jgi:hypothetical protein
MVCPGQCVDGAAAFMSIQTLGQQGYKGLTCLRLYRLLGRGEIRGGRTGTNRR